MTNGTGAGDGGGNSLELLPHPSTANLLIKSKIRKFMSIFSPKIRSSSLILSHFTPSTLLQLIHC